MRVVLEGYKQSQVFLYVLGPGGTGKTMFANTLMALLGRDRVIQTSLKALNHDQFETYNLIGKPLIMISEADSYSGELVILKQIVGNDTIKGRAKYVQGSFDIHETGNVMVVSNNPFASKEGSTAIMRRLLIFPATKIHTGRLALIEPTSNGFEGPLALELPGILN